MERQCAALCARLAAGGMDVEVWTRRIAPGAPPVERVDGYTVRRQRPGGVGRWGEYGGVGALAVRLVADRRRHDVVAVFGSGWLAVAAGLACRLTGRPWLLRPATAGDLTRFLDPSAAPTGTAAWRIARRVAPGPDWRRGVLRGADAVVAVSDEIAAEARGQGFDPGRVVAIANGVDTARIRPAGDAARQTARDALGLPGDALVVLFLGRLVARKGVLELVAAWRTLATASAGGAPAHRPAVLVIAGTGAGQRDSVAEALAAAVSDGAGGPRGPKAAVGDGAGGPRGGHPIRLVGAVDDPAAWLAASDVFVLPSHAEGLSNALLEAMAAGLAIVASDIPANRAALGSGDDTAWWHPPGDLDALADAIAAASGDATGRDRRGAAARARAVARFGLDGAAHRYAALLGALIERRPYVE